MNIVLTYDPRWEFTPCNHPHLWASLDTVNYITELLEDTGTNIKVFKADDTLESNLRKIKNQFPRSLVFWLNEFMPTETGKDIFTVEVIEKVGMMHTGPSSGALGIGLDKEATKNVFRLLGLPTPESIVVYPGYCSPINQCTNWDGYAIIKPLLQGCSKGIDEFSVISAGNSDAMTEKIEQIHHTFNEPAFVERYIGGKDAKEITVPILISHDGRIAELPVTGIDLHQLPVAQGKFRILTQVFKQENRAEYDIEEKPFLKIPADIPSETVRRVHSDVGRIIAAIGCRDLARVDIRADSNGLFYIEVNVNPGKNKSSYLCMSAYSIGLDYAELIAFIPHQGMLRYGLEPPKRLAQKVRPVLALFEVLSTVQ